MIFTANCCFRFYAILVGNFLNLREIISSIIYSSALFLLNIVTVILDALQVANIIAVSVLGSLLFVS